LRAPVNEDRHRPSRATQFLHNGLDVFGLSDGQCCSKIRTSLFCTINLDIVHFPSHIVANLYMSTSFYPKIPSDRPLLISSLLTPDTIAAPPRASFPRPPPPPPSTPLSSQAADTDDAAPQLHERQHVHRPGPEGRHRRRRILWWPESGRMEPAACRQWIQSFPASPRDEAAGFFFQNLILIWFFTDRDLLLYSPF
jgi:hypothetical protein